MSCLAGRLGALLLLVSDAARTSPTGNNNSQGQSWLPKICCVEVCSFLGEMLASSLQAFNCEHGKPFFISVQT